MSSPIIPDTYLILLSSANNYTKTDENLLPPILNKKYFRILTPTINVFYSCSFARNAYYLEEGNSEAVLRDSIILPEAEQWYETNTENIRRLTVSVAEYSDTLPDSIPLAIQFVREIYGNNE